MCGALPLRIRALSLVWYSGSSSSPSANDFISMVPLFGVPRFRPPVLRRPFSNRTSLLPFYFSEEVLPNPNQSAPIGKAEPAPLNTRDIRRQV